MAIIHYTALCIVEKGSNALNKLRAKSKRLKDIKYKNVCSIKSKAVSKSAENDIPDIPFSSVYSSISLIRWIDSHMYLPFASTVWSHLTLLLEMFLIPEASTFEATLASTFICEIGSNSLWITFPWPFYQLRWLNGYQDKNPPDKNTPDINPWTKTPWTKAPLAKNPPDKNTPEKTYEQKIYFT